MVHFLSASQSQNPKLTPEEEKVIIHKGTEIPFTGKYYAFWDKGTYVCRRCGAKLYRSENKFDAGCGWPSFDDEIPGAVKRIPDADGVRTEIQCTNCGAHPRTRLYRRAFHREKYEALRKLDLYAIHPLYVRGK